MEVQNSKKYIYDLSIIIPVFNQVDFLKETIASILSVITKYQYEVIIINDGSTEKEVKIYLDELKINKNFICLEQENKGQAAALNFGIKNSNGEFILPFDGDNILISGFIDKALDGAYENPTIDIFYSNFKKFQSGTNYLKESINEIVHPFNLQRLLLYNYIDNCAIYKREVWIKNKGYEEDKNLYRVDWEFWINAAYNNFKFKKIDEIGFYYRLHKNSMSSIKAKQKSKYNYLIIFLEKKYPDFFSHTIVHEKIFDNIRQLKLYYFIRYFLEIFFPKIVNYLYKKNKVRKNVV